MSRKLHVTFVDYAEAQSLLPLFEYYATDGQWKDVRADARIIRNELRLVQDRDYSPLQGRQVFLTQEQYDFVNDARDGIREK